MFNNKIKCVFPKSYIMCRLDLLGYFLKTPIPRGSSDRAPISNIDLINSLKTTFSIL